jgi:Pyruvate/2-oxoacid:ferredoxin oxidoreductase gamma subunit
MLGAVVRATEIVELESLMEVARDRFRGRIGELNQQMIKIAYEEAVEE